jgi:ATP-dependent DNA ligase
MGGDDLRTLPLSLRKQNLAQLLARRPDGIFVAPFEQGEIGPGLFRKACEFGLEGIVSKRLDRGGHYCGPARKQRTTRVGCESGARFISNRCWPAWGPAAAALRRSLGRRSRGGE